MGEANTHARWTQCEVGQKICLFYVKYFWPEYLHRLQHCSNDLEKTIWISVHVFCTFSKCLYRCECGCLPASGQKLLLSQVVQQWMEWKVYCLLLVGLLGSVFLPHRCPLQSSSLWTLASWVQAPANKEWCNMSVQILKLIIKKAIMFVEVKCSVVIVETNIVARIFFEGYDKLHSMYIQWVHFGSLQFINPITKSFEYCYWYILIQLQRLGREKERQLLHQDRPI